jgi:hypothetical protein
MGQRLKLSDGKNCNRARSYFYLVNSNSNVAFENERRILYERIRREKYECGDALSLRRNSIIGKEPCADILPL